MVSLKNAQTRNARAFLPFDISAVGSVFELCIDIAYSAKLLSENESEIVFFAILQDPVKKHSSPVVVAQPRPREAVARRPRQ